MGEGTVMKRMIILLLLYSLLFGCKDRQYYQEVKCDEGILKPYTYEDKVLITVEIWCPEYDGWGGCKKHDTTKCDGGGR